jgi:glycosyltransferase involved in cell wall biosynthesis/lipopolysaccharide biosynthesis protein
MRSIGPRRVQRELEKLVFAMIEDTAITSDIDFGHLVDLLRASGLFDEKYYIKIAAGMPGRADPLVHYVSEGEIAGNKPCYLFDPIWYRRRYDVHANEGNLLDHYMTLGERSGFAPSPLFDPVWYAKANGLDLQTTCALQHYMAAHPHERAPHAYFSARFYVKANPDIAQAAIDPYEHYSTWGVFENRIGSEAFDAAYVWQRYLNKDRAKNPLLLFLEFGPEFGWLPKPAVAENTVPREIRRFTAPAPEFEQTQKVSSGLRKLKALAFYLPQFHPIPENDAWWGKGFTEWRNVPRGVPRFAGHFQPRVPRDLGFYELNGTDVMKTQIEMAQAAGLFGFCFYYYNFNGRRLLERPLDAFVQDPTIDFPFCLLWANENWSRRWDGLEQEVLIGQTYDSKAENLTIDDLAGYMKSPRYVTIDGRPLFFLYRSDVVPDIANAVIRWRKRFQTVHGLNPLIVMAQAFGVNDPRPGGFDGAIEFPPHKFGSILPRITHEMEILDSDFRGDVYSYDHLVEASLKDFPRDYPLMKTAVPSWDNDARKQGSGLVVQGSTPAKFQAWLEALSRAVENKRFHGEKMIMINAWNEWCEGAYLEPDVHFGFGYLNALARALVNDNQRVARKIVLVGHDAFPAGAQMLLLNVGRALKTAFGIEIAFILMDGGGLRERYEALAPTFVANAGTDFWAALRANVEALRAKGFTHAITNSAFSGHSVGFLADNGFKVCSLIHELKTIIMRSGGYDKYQQILKRSSDVIFPNEYVRNELVSEFGAPSGRAHIMPQGLYKDVTADDSAVDSIRNLLKLPAQARIVLNTGYADLRKGVDLFLGLARETQRLDPNIHFVWVGNVDPAVEIWILDDVRRGRTSNVHFIGHTDDVNAIFNGADLFFLTSREDPFPSVVLEALAVGLPVGSFDTGGGYVDLIRAEPYAGFLAPTGDLGAAARLIIEQLAEERRSGGALRPARRAMIADKFNFRRYCFGLLDMAQVTRKISVVVPNYNYKTYLEARLNSVFGQSHPLWEVIVLDDRSTDGSVAELERLAGTMRRDFMLIENEVNSGNVFAQWQQGLEAATGELVWIAEADDLSDPSFLDNLVRQFEDPDVLLAFSDSRTIDQFGVAQWDNYKGYYNTLFPGALAESEVFDGETFLRDYLSVKNIILNVSCVLWRKDALAEALSRCQDNLKKFKMAGDWRIYAELCMLGGKVAYEAQPLNIHRRHATSVTHALKKETHRGEIMSIHQLVRAKLGRSAPTSKQDEYLREITREFELS